MDGDDTALMLSGTTAEISQDKRMTENQVKNKSGGYVYAVDDMSRLRRFVCLGSENGNYYTGEKELGLENAQTIQKLIENGRGKDVVSEITTFSVEGRAAKQNPIIFVLAMCARDDHHGDVKKAAYEAMPKICRIPTHLFSFVEYCESLSKGTGWGRAHRRAIASWYLSQEKSAMHLAMHVTKYRNRNGWAHKDLLRLSHPKTQSEKLGLILKYIIKGVSEAKEAYLKDESTSVDESLWTIFNFLEATETIKHCASESDVADMILRHGLVREHVPTQFLNSKRVWEALLEKMPMTAMLRNLAKMTVIGLIENGSPASDTISARLIDEHALKKARIHPFNVLTALYTYKQGRGEKGKLKWTPVAKISQALEKAFYLSFKNVERTNLRYCIALDVSGSMECGGIIGNTAISPRVGSAAMSMVTARTEKNHEFVGFSRKIVPLPITADMDIHTVMKTVDSVPMGDTDCAQPMLWAKKYNKKFDVFIIYTDSETWAGKVHPAQALREYRKKSGIWNAKLIVCAMTSNEFTLADPEDPGMLDMAGFDSAAPEIIRNFSLGFI